MTSNTTPFFKLGQGMLSTMLKRSGWISLCVSNGNLNLDSGLDVDGGDLLDDLRGRVQVDHALVDAQLELVPRLRALAARRFAGGDAKRLVGHAHRAFHLQFLLLSATNQLSAHLLKRRHVLGGKGDANSVHLLLLLNSFSILERHFSVELLK